MDAASRAADPLRRFWGPVTVRVAWDLLRAGVAVRSATLRAAREHALYRVEGATHVTEAEVRATRATEEFLARVDGRFAPLPPDPDAGLRLDPAWRNEIAEVLEPVHDAVLRLHYADGVTLEDMERSTRLDLVVLRAAREAVREVARDVLSSHGVSVGAFDAARLDRLLARLATCAHGNACPGPGGLATDTGRAHADRCPRCARALRLIKEGILSPSDLFPPDDAPCLVPSTIDALLVLVHPDGRRHVRGLLDAFGDAARPLDDDGVLVDCSACPEPDAVMVALAEGATPPATQMRVVRRAVRGRLHRSAPVGPGVDELRAATAALRWGETLGVAELPEPLPAPPSASRWWASAVLLGLLAVAAAAVGLAGPDGGGLPVEAARAADGVRFDMEDHAFAYVVAVRGNEPEIAFSSGSWGDKGGLATGDGRYLLPAAADAFVVIAAPAALDDLSTVVDAAAAADGGPSAALADAVAGRVRARFPEAGVVVVR